MSHSERCMQATKACMQLLLVSALLFPPFSPLVERFVSSTPRPSTASMRLRICAERSWPSEGALLLSLLLGTLLTLFLLTALALLPPFETMSCSQGGCVQLVGWGLQRRWKSTAFVLITTVRPARLLPCKCARPSANAGC